MNFDFNKKSNESILNLKFGIWRCWGNGPDAEEMGL